MLFNNKIDVIIPAYNVPDKLLFECLSSIAIQEIKEDIKITIVDDASTEENYENICQLFNSFLDIQILRMNENGGPGVARQYGLDHTENEFVTFIDADDIFADSFSLFFLRSAILESPLNQMATGEFQELISNEFVDVSFLTHEQDLTWMFGKLYRRLFLEKHQISFHPTSRANEDAGFNALCKIYCMASEETENITYVPASVYFWRNHNDNSITRQNDNNYSLTGKKGGSFYGYVENISRATSITLNDNSIKDKSPINEFIVGSMVSMYLEYIQNLYQAPEEDNLLNKQWCKQFFKEFYEPLETEGLITKEMVEDSYYTTIVNNYRLNRLVGMVPQLTYHQFLDQLREE